MRPVTKGDPFQYNNGQPYKKAINGLIARLGRYCSYCERIINSSLEVEHIQPKSIHPDKEKIWNNFLLACKNCNATKGNKNPPLNDWLIPDRDNTFAAFKYLEDGVIEIRNGLPPAIVSKARRTIDMMGLNKQVRETLDDKGNFVAIDRHSQRMEAWLLALRYRKCWNDQPGAQWEQMVAGLARNSGFFSIWMAAFTGVPQIRNRLIHEFAGTEHQCFHQVTTAAERPHPNPDNLPHGGKS